MLRVRLLLRTASLELAPQVWVLLQFRKNACNGPRLRTSRRHSSFPPLISMPLVGVSPRPALLRATIGPAVFPGRSRTLVRQVVSKAESNPERQPRPENVQGDIYVDRTCIDCDTCRWMAPSVFGRVGTMSAVVKQPESPEERQQALQALLSCPTFSIHAQNTAPGELAAARDSLPQLVRGCRDAYHIGFHAENSYGATPYLIRRPPLPTGASSSGSNASAQPPASLHTAPSSQVDPAIPAGGSSPSPAAAAAAATPAAGAVAPAGSGRQAGGNIMVDVPRWNPALAKRLERLGGVSWIFLTHEDDVSDHAAWARHFGATRIIHRLEVNASQGTDVAEWQLEGEGPWELGEDVLLIFTPGHTAGCVSLLYRPDRALFTGDHLAYSQRLGRLTIFRNYNWHSVSQQLESVHKLLQFDFVHVLPGHGRRASFPDVPREEILKLLDAEGWRQPAPTTA